MRGELTGKRVVVVGLGTSGVAAARLCLRRGASVVANDARPIERLSDDAKALEALGARIVAGGHESAGIPQADLVVVSPGVPPLPQVDEAHRRGVPVWGEVELAVRSLERP